MTDLVEWLKAGSTLIGAAGVSLAYYQIRKAVRWNKVNATFTYLNNTAIMERERKAAEALDNLGINLYLQTSTLDENVVVQIRQDPNIYKEIKELLNLFEGYATALNAGALDYELAYNLRADRFIRHFDIFECFIKKERAAMDNDMYWVEMERVHDKWKPRREREKKEQRERLAAKKRY
jgi:hypothetical protein